MSFDLLDCNNLGGIFRVANALVELAFCEDELLLVLILLLLDKATHVVFTSKLLRVAEGG